jgi:hypothetical protein
VVTSTAGLAGFGGNCRPRGGRSCTPVSFKYAEIVSRRMPQTGQLLREHLHQAVWRLLVAFVKGRVAFG